MDVDEPSESGRSKRYRTEPPSEDASEDDDGDHTRYFYSPVSGIYMPGMSD
jgi:hypothetical protein